MSYRKFSHLFPRHPIFAPLVVFLLFEWLKDEGWMLLCCLDDGSRWWLRNMFMGIRFIAAFMR